MKKTIVRVAIAGIASLLTPLTWSAAGGAGLAAPGVALSAPTFAAGPAGSGAGESQCGPAEVSSALTTPEPEALLDFQFCRAETSCTWGGSISCDGFSNCLEQNQCWVWCDGYLQYCPMVPPQYCPEAPPEY